MRRSAPMILLTVAALSVTAAAVPVEPPMVLLGTLGGDASFPTAVNDRGQVVGAAQTATGAFHAFLWDGGRMIDLAPGFASSTALDVNDDGGVLLQRWIADDQPAESVLVSKGEVISLGAVDARFVNDRGQVAGTVLNVDDPADPTVNPFVWDRGVRTDMGPIPGWEGRNSRVVDFNDRGAVLGIGLGPESFEVGFVWWNGRFEPVGDPHAFGGSGVVDINDHGQVAGADFPNGAFLWDSGRLTYLGSVPGRGRSEPSAVNERGEVAGPSASVDVGVDRSFFWRRGVFAEIGPADGSSSRAVDLNDRGQVVGEFPRFGGGEVTLSVFLWEDGTFTDLGANEETSMNVSAISEKGHVIGTVMNAAGVRQAFLIALG